MWVRRVSDYLVKKLGRDSQFARVPHRAQANGWSWSCSGAGTNIFAAQSTSHYHESGSKTLLSMLLQAQAALFIGGTCSFVFSEQVSTPLASQNNDQGSSDVGFRLVEDTSVISNEHTSKWRIFTDNAREFFMQGKLNEAEKLFSSALEEAKKGFGERDPHVASACNNLAELYRVRKSYDKAEPLYLDAIRILEEAFGSEDVRVGAACHNLGQFYIVQRKLQEARSCYEIKGRVLGHGHSDYAETMFHLGTVLYLQGNESDSEVLIKDSIRILEEGGQGESYSCIRKLRYLAKIYMNSKNRLEEAENVQRKILHIMELTKGWKSLDTVIAAETLTVTLQSKGQLKDAQELLERCLDVRRELLPEDHLQIGANMLSLANVALLNSEKLRKIATSESLMELDRAKKLIEDSMRIAQKVLDASRHKRKIQNLEQRTRNDQHIALVIFLRSLKALAHLEKTKDEIQETEKALPVPEAEKALRQCMRAFKEYGAISTLVEPKVEYISCMKNLLNMIGDTSKNTTKSRLGEMEELKDEIRRAEAEISSPRTPSF
ncbi:uncharacterized protein LOC141613170 isoform X2 [Silene latifolia]|uniref:uncharacterized protein LOC141613170 isoform X2 n=1 Tax=Silene latifolia TaxID=37657 RepID=UPI003D76C69B